MERANTRSRSGTRASRSNSRSRSGTRSNSNTKSRARSGTNTKSRARSRARTRSNSRKPRILLKRRKTALDHLAGPRWPDKMILFVSTHGTIICEKDVLETFSLPPGIELKRMQVATPGIVNFASDSIMSGYVSMINAHRDELLSNNEGTQDAAIIKMMKYIRINDLIESEDLKRGLAHSPDDSDDEDHQGNITEYLQGLNRSHRIQTYKSTPESAVDIINKTYTRENQQKTKNDWTIKAMNIPGQPDLLAYMKKQTRHGNSTVTIKEIVDECLGHGVKQLMLFDFSCGSIADHEYNPVKTRHVRILRRRITAANV